MPLVPGASRAVIGGNIAEMERSGYPPRRAIAAALSDARRHPGFAKASPDRPRASGGLVPRFDDGGGVDPFPFTDPMTGVTPEQGAQYLRSAWHGYQDWLARQPDYAGQLSELRTQGVPPSDPRYLDAMLPLALGFVGSGVLGEAGAASRLPLALESRVAPAYNAPTRPPRPFAADYPSGAQTDAAGRLTADIEGGPLGAQYIAGRRVGVDLGGDDQALTPAEIKSVATSAAGAGPEAVAPRQIRGAAGALQRTVDPETGEPQYRVFLDRNLSDALSSKVLEQETGHLIDELSGRIPTDGVKTELKQVYNTLNTGRERTRNLTGPQHLGYSGEAADRELMAEAIRGYLANPNYLKTAAPKTAARIRAYVNANPRLAPLIQFNAIGAAPWRRVPMIVKEIKCHPT